MVAYSHIMEVGTGKTDTAEKSNKEILSGSCQRLYVKYTHAGEFEKEGYSRARARYMWCIGIMRGLEGSSVHGWVK